MKPSPASNNSATKNVVAVESAGQRIDNYLLRLLKGVPKSHVYRILRSGEVRVNSRRCAPTYRVEAGDEVRLPPLRLAERAAPEPETAAAAANVALPVLYEDEALIALDKPSGIAVHGGSGVSFGVIEALRRQRPQARFLELAHRLDRETSGILLVGKKRSVLHRLHETFRHGGQGAEKLDKRYLVLVRGRWMEAVRHARFPLFKDLTENSAGERRVRVSEEGKYAHTVFRLRARWQRFSLLEAQLKTGRTHQIRVHLAHLGYPVAGDGKYGDFALNKALGKEGLKRMFLHAARLSLPYPGNGDAAEKNAGSAPGAPLLLEAPLPPELESFLAYLARTEEQDYGKKF